MFNLLSILLKRKPALPPQNQTRDPQRYEKEKKRAVSERKAERMTLAKSTRTHQEILYYLAEKDPDSDVRRAVACNPSTPPQAGQALAMDTDPDVRYALAERLVALLPHLSREKHSRLYAYTVQTLGTLALDEVLRIRIALSSALKDIASAPPKLANTLARDVEKAVAEPILRFCAALSDSDLLDILETHPESWAAAAIAGRQSLSGEVSEAIIKKSDAQAGAVLIGNEGATITDMLLEEIIERSRHIPQWQAPLASRPSLPPHMIRELAKFAQNSVQTVLSRRKDLDEETRQEVAKVFERRLNLDATDNLATHGGEDITASEEKAGTTSPRKGMGRKKREAASVPGSAAGEETAPDLESRISALAAQKELHEEKLLDYLGMRDYTMAAGILARMAGITPGKLQSVLDMKAAKPLVAVCWKAGLSMRGALQIEKNLARIDPTKLLYPRGGTEYPLNPEEIQWQLEFLGMTVDKDRS